MFIHNQVINFNPISIRIRFIRDLAKSILKQKKSITHISQEEKKTSINIYFIIHPFFHFKASKQ